MKPSAKPILLIGIVSLAFSFAGCTTVRTATGCSALAEAILTRTTPHAELADSGDALLDWQLYGTAEAGQLNAANDDKRTGFEIIRGCEARDAEAARPRWRLW